MEKMKKTKPQPARTPKQQENILIGLAVDEAERRLRDGTASASLVCKILDLALNVEKRKLEKDKLKADIDVQTSKVKEYESSANLEKLYREAIDAMTIYGGNGADLDKEMDNDY